MTLERYDLIPDAAPEDAGLVELAVLPELVRIDTAAIDIVGGTTQQIDVALSAFLEDAEPVDDADVLRDDDIHLDEQPLAPASAREAAVAIDEGLHT